jgi:hypothetical protein
VVKDNAGTEKPVRIDIGTESGPARVEAEGDNRVQPPRVEAEGDGRIQQPPRVETEGDGRVGQRVETSDGGTTGGGVRNEAEAGPVEANPAVTTARDVSAIRNGQKVKVGGHDAVFVATDAQTGDVVVRTGKPTQPTEQFYNQKQFGKMKWHEVGRDTSTNRTLYRDKEGRVFEVRPHGSGFMTAERSEYRGVRPEEVK